MKKLNNKQISDIAIMWSAALLAGCDNSSFDKDFPQEHKVVDAVRKIATTMLGDLPLLTSLPEIINYVRSKK